MCCWPLCAVTQIYMCMLQKIQNMFAKAETVDKAYVHILRTTFQLKILLEAECSD